MAKQTKPIKEIPSPEQVYSKKYRCNIMKLTAFFDEVSQDWFNEKIEIELMNNKKFTNE